MKDWDESEKLIKNRVLERGEAVVELGFLFDYEKEWANEYSTRWYRSKTKKGGDFPFGSYLLNKKWTLEEEFNYHMMIFQQVTASSIYYI